MSDKYLLDKLSRDFKSISASLSEVSKERDSLLAKLQAAESEKHKRETEYMERFSIVANQLTQERAINAVLSEACAEVIRNSHDIIAKKRCSKAMAETEEMRDGE